MSQRRAPVSIDDAVLRRLRGLLSADGTDTLDLHSPVDGARVGALPVSTPADVDAAAQRARAAQSAWAAEPVHRRAQVLLNLHDAILDNRDELTDLLQAEGGKSRLSAVEEVLHTALTARYYGRTAARYLRSERGDGLVPLLTRVDRHLVPVGLVGVIAPWNYPLTLALSDGLAALVAGNAVLLKPDAQTPLVALRGVELLREAGMPAALWPVVYGPGGEVGGAVIEHSDYVCFTGSTRTGRSVAARCADRLIGCSLELGGKNPLLVLADADVEAAAAGAVRASFANAGQLCVSAERIYIAEPVREAFTAAFVSRVAALRLGYGPDFEHDMGGLINPRQLDTVRRHVADARAKGAQVLTGGRARPGPGSAGLRAHGPDRRHPRDGVLRRGNVRTGGQPLRRRRRGRGSRPGQRLRLRPERQRVERRPRTRPSRGPPAPLRHGERQRRLLRHLRQPRRPPGRNESVRARPATGPRRDPPLRRGPGDRDADGPTAGSGVRVEPGRLHRRPDRRPPDSEEDRSALSPARPLAAASLRRSTP